MEIIENIPEKGVIQAGSVLTIGNFDGVHAGHQEIINIARSYATKKGGKCVALTFDPHPVAILRPEKTPGVLTPLAMKKHLLENCGVDYLVVIKDSLRLLNMSPEAFVDDFLMQSINPVAIVEGSDFNFGYGKSGDAKLLKDMGISRGFEVDIVQPLQVDLNDGNKAICSSSLIRQSLERGDVQNASKMLTRYYRLAGKVIKGRGKGRELGFPTANIDPHDQVIPAEGVYAGYVSIAADAQAILSANQKIPAAFSIGRIKTFKTDHPLLIEAHLLSEDPGDMYGKFMAMDFVAKLRNQKRFKSEAALMEQIENDCSSAADLLS